MGQAAAALDQDGLRILVVDDDPITRGMIREALPGWRVEEARTLAEARTALERGGQPDVVVLDGLLPDGMGTQLLVELERDAPELPVVFASAFYRDAGSQKTLRDVMRVTVVAKPFRPTEVRSAIHRAAVLGRGSVWTAPVA